MHTDFRTAKPRLLARFYLRAILPRLAYGAAGYRGLARRLAAYADRERLTPAENQRLQWGALQALLNHAYETSPFYRKRFDQAGLHPADIRTSEDLAKLPPLTREDIRENLEDMWSRRFTRQELQKSYTGGTTSTPVPFLLDLDSVREKVAIKTRLCWWAGWQPGDKVLFLWGAQQDFPENPTWKWRVASEFLMREIYTPTSLLNEERMESRRQTLNRFKPRIICAFPTPMTMFCEYLSQSGLPYHRPISVVCGAEPLLDHQRQLIESVMGCRVFNQYRTREFGTIAGECEAHSGMHLIPAAAFTEFVPVAGAEEEGLQEILVTDLSNYGMPLIRYQVNDCAIVASEPCPCGVGYPLLRKLTGRASDVFQLSNGDKVPGVSLIRLAIGFCTGISKMQVIQETIDTFRIRYVPGPDFAEGELLRLQKKLEERFRVPVHWVFERVEKIERERSGKTRYCISHVAQKGFQAPETVDKS